MSAQTPQNNQQGNTTQTVVQPTVVNNTATTDTGAQINTVQAPATTYYAKLNAKMYKENGTTKQTAGNLPYILVRNTTAAPNTWTVVKANKTDTSTGLTVIPITEVGEYRIYVKEPNTSPAVGSTYDIPYHMLTNGTNSTHLVQPWFALTVVAGTEANTISVTTSLPNSLNRTTGYPTTGTNYTLDSTNNTSAKAKSLGEHIITHQLWSDCSRAYGTNHADITASTYRTALETVYGETMTKGTGTGNQHQRRLIFQDGTTQREVNFIHSSTAGARGTNCFSSSTAMTSDEAIRRVHPSVLVYWLQVMHDLDITYTRIGSAWRPHTGSTRHRYSLALDFNEITALVEVTAATTNTNTTQQAQTNQAQTNNQPATQGNNSQPQTQGQATTTNNQPVQSATPQQNNAPTQAGNATTPQTVSVTITLRNDTTAGQLCEPTLAITTSTSVDNKRKIELSRKLFKRLAKDRADKLLGWLGGPWALKYNTAEINHSASDTEFIKTDNTHKNHVHLSIGTEQG